MRCESHAEYSYFLWLIGKAHAYQYLPKYENAFRRLHELDYIWTMELDEDRAIKGCDLRQWFDEEVGSLSDYDYCRPCSMLELMVSLAIDCDERLMWNSYDGNRTDVWFWNMFCNLGLIGMRGKGYDQLTVDTAVLRFLNKDYPPNGEGGLFYTNRDDVDMRELELWYQLMYWISAVNDI